MSWLDDLRAPTDISSNRKLAKAMHEHPAWPNGEEMSLVALSNQLNSANRGERLDWWLDGRGLPFFPVLAAVLELTELELREAFAAAGGVPADRRDTFTFEEFPGLPALDLRKEDLPDWLPWQVRTGQHGSWWQIADRTSTALVGQWLAVRESWVLLRDAAWVNVVHKIPASGGVFIELEDSAGVPDLDEVSGDGSDRRVLIACPLPPTARVARVPPAGLGAQTGPEGGRGPAVDFPDEGEGDEGGWRVVTLEEGKSAFRQGQLPRRHWRRTLLRWVRDHAIKGGGLDLDWMEETLGAGGFAKYASTPGDLLLLLGLFDEVGTERIREPDGEDIGGRLLRTWWKSVCQRMKRLAPEIAGVIQTAGLALLVEAEARRLAGGTGLHPDLDGWAQLLPLTRVQPTVSDAMIEDLKSADPDRRAQVIQMLRRPSTSELTEALRAAGALRSLGGGFAVGPTLIAELLRPPAIEHLLRTDPLALGTLLLDAERSAETMAHLFEVAQAGDWGAMEVALDACDVTVAKGAALLDGLVRSVGWTALDPDSPTPPAALCDRLWAAQAPFLIQRWTNHSPAPLLQVTPSTDREAAFTRSFLWPVCRLGLSWTLYRAGRCPPASSESPWAGGLEGKHLTALAQSLSDAAATLRSTQHSGGSMALLDDADRMVLAHVGSRLFDAVGPIQHHSLWLTDWQGPALLCEAAQGRLPEALVPVAEEVASQLPFPLEAIVRIAALRGVPHAQVLEWAAETWVGERWQGPLYALPEARHLAEGPDLEVTQRLWEAVPPRLFTEQLCQALLRLKTVWPWLSNAQWEAALVHLKQAWGTQHEQVPVELLAQVPSALVTQLVRENLGTQHPMGFYGAVWEAHPKLLPDLLDEIASVEPPIGDQLTHLARALHAAPAGQVDALVQRVHRWLESPALVPHVDASELRRWLAFVIEGRKPGWERAWEILRPR